VTGDAAAAKAHYNVLVLRGDAPPIISGRSQVWLDCTVTTWGRAHAVDYGLFVPAPGNRAVVIHREPTPVNGTAGARLACLPVSWRSVDTPRAGLALGVVWGAAARIDTVRAQLNSGDCEMRRIQISSWGSSPAWRGPDAAASGAWPT